MAGMRGSDRKEHTSELQSRGLISYAVFCLKKKDKYSAQVAAKAAGRARWLGDGTAAATLRGLSWCACPGTVKVSGYGRCFFFNDTATTEIYTLSLHDALPICLLSAGAGHYPTAGGAKTPRNQ